jgi:hypothetical protein
MKHKLLLGMYAFQIKRPNTSNKNTILLNDFLSKSYPDEETKFAGFVQDLISQLDSTVFKSEGKTHGGILTEKSINLKARVIDISIDGGVTGIKQYLIDPEGNKSELSNEEIVGLRFFARLWLPSGSKTGYVFIQKYSSISIKRLFDSLLKKTFEKPGYNMVQGRTISATTKKRQKEFIQNSRIRDIIVVSTSSLHQTSMADAVRAEIRLKNVIKTSNGQFNIAHVEAAAANHGFKIEGKDYLIKTTYENTTDGSKEEKTILLDSSEDSINLIPNIILPNSCINMDNQPIFRKMQEFIDKEMEQITKESKLK